MLNFFSASLAAALISSASPLAAPDIFICDIKSHSPIGWIPPKLALIFSDNYESADVFDGYIKEYVGEPLQADMRVRSATSYLLNWEIASVKFSNMKGGATVRYSAMFDHNTMKVRMSAVYSGMDLDPPRGTGSCKPAEG